MRILLVALTLALIYAAVKLKVNPMSSEPNPTPAPASDADMIPVLRVAAPARATASMIIVHGLGDSGEGWTFLSDMLHSQDKFKHINFVFPSAPAKPLFVNGNMPVPRWFNIYELGNPNAPQDEEGYWQSVGFVQDLVKKEVAKGIPADRVVVGGFSQGAVVSLGVVASSDQKLAGIVNMSGIFAMKKGISKYLQEINKETPIFHGHGDLDPMFNVAFARQTADYFKSLGFKNYDYHEYLGMVHTTCPEELHDISSFIEKVIPQLSGKI